MSLLPSRGPETSTRQEGEFEVVGVDEDVAPVLDALASDTAREVLNAIYEEPGTPSEIADRLDMSIQKVAYHLEKLEEVDLIAVAGTRYSEKGQEMTVYEPPEDPLVLFVGTEERKSRLKSLVRRVVPTVGALGIGSLLVQRLFGGRGSPFFDGGSGEDELLRRGVPASGGDTGGDAGGNGADVALDSAETATESLDMEASEATSTPMATDGGQVATETPAAMETPAPDFTATSGDASAEYLLQYGAESASQGMEPGLAFFLGGVFALTLVGAWWMYRNRSR